MGGDENRHLRLDSQLELLVDEGPARRGIVSATRNADAGMAQPSPAIMQGTSRRLSWSTMSVWSHAAA